VNVSATPSEICFWCAKSFPTTEMTDDHCPPRGIFPKRVHRTLRVVRACRGCNGGWGNDSDYLRDWLAYLLKDLDRPEVAEIKATYERARQGRLDRGKLADVWPTRLELINIPERGPLSFRPIGVPDPNSNRIADILTRIIGELNSHGPSIPAGPESTACFRAFLPGVDKYSVALQLLAEEYESTGEGIFKWRYRTNPNDSREIEWLMSFYDYLAFSVQIMAPNATKSTSVFFGDVIDVAKLVNPAPPMNLNR
jgi:hypothetical protein